MNFRVGQKVVCVDDSPPQDPRNIAGGYWMPNWPVKGQVYTIRGLTFALGLHLEEVVNPIRPFSGGSMEGCFLPLRFRPVVERKTDISIFTKLLNPSEIEKARKDLERA